MIAPLVQTLLYISGDISFIVALMTKRLLLAPKMKRFAMILLGWSLLWSAVRLPFIIIRKGFYADLCDYIAGMLLIILMCLVVQFHLEVIRLM